MLRILKFLWTGKWGHDCKHKWEIRREGNITSYGDKIGYYYELQCKKCGDLKERRF
jgi:hypothetical protein